MPFGLTNAPAEFQRLMDTIFRGVLWNFVLVYIDDIVVYSNTFQDHLQHLQESFSRLKKSGMKLKPSKCKLFLSELPLLGHLVTRNGLKVLKSQVDKVMEYPIPETKTHIKSFLGLVQFYARFVPELASISSPLRQLLRKKAPFIWTKACQEAFEKLKTILTTPPHLIRPDESKPFILRTDASKTGVGAVLSQLDEEGIERVVAYASKALNDAETRYSTLDQEFLAVYWAIHKRFSHYLRGAKFTLLTDHQPLKSILTTKEPMQGRGGR
jgi:RNase H-like domain found in reverse transcriptase/Reverse transcriptase (RNA-dependent DNA polymerase)